MSISAVLLVVAVRPRLDRAVWTHGGSLLLFGLAIAGMNLCLYQAIARIPLGIAVTIDFMGPLMLAVATSRRLFDFVWIALAVAGVALLSPEIGGALDPLGILFAAGAAVGWTSFILLSRRLGRALHGTAGLALGMVVAAICLLPVVVFGAGPMRIDPLILLAGLAVAMLSTALPLSLEFEALKRLPPRSYGVLVALEPAVAALVGLILLGQALGPHTLLALSFVTAAALGITLFERRS